jgi:hypothetical protein
VAVAVALIRVAPQVMAVRVAAGMDKQMVALLLKAELQIPAAEVAVLETIPSLTDKRLAVAAPASSFCDIPISSPSLILAVVLHLPLQLMATLRSQPSLQEQETFNL